MLGNTYKFLNDVRMINISNLPVRLYRLYYRRKYRFVNVTYDKSLSNEYGSRRTIFL
jgi:hypothetical protein